MKIPWLGRRSEARPASPLHLLLDEEQGRFRVSLEQSGRTLIRPTRPVPFVSPFSAGEREDLYWYLEDYLVSPYAAYEDRGTTIAKRLPEWGEQLFRSSLGAAGPVHAAYLKARTSRCWELWIRSSSSSFLGHPWELLRDPEHSTPLALEVALNRTVPGPAVTSERLPSNRLRVLTVIARPRGVGEIRYGVIVRPLLERLETVEGRIELEVLRPPTFAALKECLADAGRKGKPYHILHFDGHGALAPARADGPRTGDQVHLLFETARGDSAPVTADHLAALLSQAHTPLLVLNACRSGMMAGGPGPEAAVAVRLLAGGTISVVAMSYSIHAVAAAEFMTAFYEALFSGATTAEAVAAGRRRIHAADRRPSPRGPMPLADWIVPVHYTRGEVSFPELTAEQRGDGASRAIPSPRFPGPLAPDGGMFFGRDSEFLALERALRACRVVVIHGLAGTGKTELAKGFARWLHASGGLDASSLVFFHSFQPGAASGLDEAIQAVGLELVGADFGRLEPGPRRQLVVRALHEHRILLIWDNFESIYSLPSLAGTTPPLDDAARKTMKAFLAQVAYGALGAILITSRSPERWLGDVQRLEVGGLAPEDVLELSEALLASTPQARARREDRSYPALLQALAGHPLALRLTLPLLAQVENPRELVDALRAPGNATPVEWQASLGACLHISLQSLEACHRRRLPALALFEGTVDPTILSLISTHSEVPARFRVQEGGSQSPDELVNRAFEMWWETLERCVESGLLTRMEPLIAQLYRVHPALRGPLLALWREQAGDAFVSEHTAAREASLTAHAYWALWLEEQVRKGRAEIAAAVIAAQQQTLTTQVLYAMEQDRFREAESLLQPLLSFWDFKGAWDEALSWTDRIRALLEKASSGPPPDLDKPAGHLWLFMVGSQARLWLRAGRLDAAAAEYESIRKLLENSTSQWGRRCLAMTYHNLASIAEERQDVEAAEALYHHSLEMKDAENDRTSMALSFRQLASIALRRGDLSQAENWTRQALEIEQNRRDLEGMATSFFQMAEVADHRGDLDVAEALYFQALQAATRQGNRVLTATLYQSLGDLAKRRSKSSAAEAYYQSALEILERLPETQSLSDLYDELGMLAEERGDFRNASGWYQRSLALQKDLGNSLGLADSYHRLARLAYFQGNQEQAQEWFRNFTQIMEKQPGTSGFLVDWPPRRGRPPRILIMPKLKNFGE